ncbi:hypothetical protein KCU65_g8069, partial [Aureobasidium melanogenum]
MLAFDVEDDTIDELVVAETVDESFDVLEVLGTVDDTTEVLVTEVPCCTIDVIVVTLTTTTLELVGVVEDTGTLDDEDTMLEEFKIYEELRDTARVLVATLTVDVETNGVDDDDDECDVLLAALPVLELTVLEVGATDDAMTNDPALDDAELDAEDTMLEGITLVSATLETEVETLELDKLLKETEDTVDDPALELVERLCDVGRTFVATPIATVLMVVVKITRG